MFRKAMVLGMAVGVVAALALPASASATWKHHNTSIVENVQLGWTGNMRFQGSMGGIECQITSRIKFLAGQAAGTVETLVPHPTNETTNCKGLGGLAFCQIHDTTPQAPNWTLHAGFETPGGTKHASAATLTAQDMQSQLTGGFCPIKHIRVTAGNIGLIPNQPTTVSSGALSGSLQLDLQTNAGEVHKETLAITGQAQIESPNQNTYSF